MGLYKIHDKGWRVLTKKLLVSISLMFLIIISISFITIRYLLDFIEPQVTIEASIKPITLEDYKRIEGSKEISMYKYNIDSFRTVTIRFEFKQPLFVIRDRKINTGFIFGDFDKVISSDKRIVAINGGGFQQDNESESKAIYEYQHNILLNNISDGELANLFDDLKVEIEWSNILKGEDKRVYYIKDYLNVVD